MIYARLSENIVNMVYIESIHGIDKCMEILSSGGIKISIDLWVHMSSWYKIKFVGERLPDKEYTITDFEEIKKPTDLIIPEQTEIEKLQDEVTQLTEQNMMQDELINVTMMATDEVFTLLEPLLNPNPKPLSIQSTFRIARKEVKQPMVDLYVAMVIRGLKDIEDVPARYREQVKEILAALEK